MARTQEASTCRQYLRFAVLLDLLVPMALSMIGVGGAFAYPPAVGILGSSNNQGHAPSEGRAKR